MPLLKKLLLILTVVMLVSCKSIGPWRVHMDRQVYNTVLRDTEQEQLLANIVRSRYLENTQYIQVGGLTANYQLSESLASTATSNFNRPSANTYVGSLSPTINYSDNPTISYLPLSDADFANSLLTPVSMLNFILLLHAGGFDQVALFDVFFEQLNYIDGNMLTLAGRNYTTQEQIRFWHIMKLLHDMEKKDVFDLPRSVLYKKQLGIMIRFKNNLENSSDALALKRLLGVARNSKSIVFMEHTFDEDLHEEKGVLVINQTPTLPRNLVYVRLRSIIAAIKFLGYGVQIPEEDIRAHITRELITPDGRRFDWSHKMKNIFTVYSSNNEPRANVLVKTRIHNHWFYIKASDLATKETLIAVLRLFTLTSVTTHQTNNLPVITIPVGR